MCPGATSLAAGMSFGVGDGPIIANVACSGTEVQLTDCVFNITHGCVHNDDVTVRCIATGSGKSKTENLPYRLDYYGFDVES